MVKNILFFDEDEDDAILDMMFGNCDSQDEMDEAIGDMMNSFDGD